MVWLLVFNATFNNISVISWRSVLLVEEAGVPGENTDMSPVTDKIYYLLDRVHIAWAGLELTTLVLICIDCIVVVNLTAIRSRPRRSQLIIVKILINYPNSARPFNPFSVGWAMFYSEKKNLSPNSHEIK